MLVLSRKKDKGLTISHPAGDIHVVVVEIRGDKVRLGVDANKSIAVHRDEVWAAIQQSQSQGSDSDGNV